MQTVLEKIASFAVHTDFDQIPADVAAVAKLGLTDFLPVLLPESMHRSAKHPQLFKHSRLERRALQAFRNFSFGRFKGSRLI